MRLAVATVGVLSARTPRTILLPAVSGQGMPEVLAQGPVPTFPNAGSRNSARAMDDAAFLEISLVVVFRGVELGSRRNLGDNRVTMAATAAEFLF